MDLLQRSLWEYAGGSEEREDKMVSGWGASSWVACGHTRWRSRGMPLNSPHPLSQAHKPPPTHPPWRKGFQVSG